MKVTNVDILYNTILEKCINNFEIILQEVANLCLFHLTLSNKYALTKQTLCTSHECAIFTLDLPLRNPWHSFSFSEKISTKTVQC